MYKGRVLLLKRRNIPLILNPGIWSFLSGGRKKGERYLRTAYREIREETSLQKKSLKLLHHSTVTVVEPRLKQKWPNHLYLFKSDTNKVILDMENSSYRWATISELRNHTGYTNVFNDEKTILNAIGRLMHGPSKPKKEDK